MDESYVRCASLVAQEDNLMAINSFLVYVKMFKYLNNIPKLARETNQRPKPRQRQRRNCRPPSDLPPACTVSDSVQRCRTHHAAARSALLTVALPTVWAALAAPVQHAGERGARHRALPVRTPHPCKAHMPVYVVCCLLYAIPPPPHPLADPSHTCTRAARSAHWLTSELIAADRTACVE
jgi:hypothetical protein